MRLSIIGSGPGGYVAAIRAAQLGAQVTVIEEEEVGGTCLNRGCIPTKSLVASAEALSTARKSEDFGLDLKGEISPNLSRILARKDRIVSMQVKGVRNLFKSWGITLKEGRGTLISPNDLRVTLKDGSEERIESDRTIIATGSRPFDVPAFPFDGANIISSNDALRLDEIPKNILIVGAGIIGCEFACILKEFGSDVTLVEMLPRAVATEDIEISELLEREFRKKKIKLIKNVKAERMDIRDDGVHAMISDGKEIIAEKVLVAVGRTLNSNGIGIEEIGVEEGKRGEIAVNGKMETNIPGVYAIGDVVGGPLLAHVASRQGIIAVRNVMGNEEEMDYSVVPSAIFTSPEIASVGLREQDAAARNINIRTGHFHFRALGKAHVIGEIDGLVKIVSDLKTDRVLGVHIIGPHASDLIHEGTLAIRNGLMVKDVSETIHAHPTLSEVFMEAAEDVHGEAIHAPRR
jgi:dihydrolipoamide dehydrogenase